MVRGVVLAVSWLALSVGAAQAEETYPTGVRTITATAATSACIGDISTPICALETLFACLARRDPTLCRATETPSEGEHADQTYRIVGYAILRDHGNASTLHAEITVDDLRPDRDMRDYYYFIHRDGSWFYRDSAPDGEWSEELHIDPAVTEVVETHGHVVIAPSSRRREK